jgi:2-keto-3-deoxy-L-rhamnonate aldolase RhmA
MTGSSFRKALKSGQRVYGTMTVSDATRWPDMLASLGLDFIFIDTEHIAIDRTALSWMCQTYAAHGMAPIVRIPSPDPYVATVASDAGAQGIIAPYVETVEQVQALRGAVKYRPLKGERLKRLLEGAPTEPRLAEYLKKHNQDHTLIINVESVAAWENLDNLLAVPDLDAILIGPHDLSTTMGIPEDYANPDFDRAVIDILSRARKAGVGAGIHVTTGDGLNTEDHIRWIEAGANLIVHRADVIAAQHLLSRELKQIRDRFGDTASNEGDVDLNI